jgi:hypothetical protein
VVTINLFASPVPVFRTLVLNGPRIEKLKHENSILLSNPGAFLKNIHYLCDFYQLESTQYVNELKAVIGERQIECIGLDQFAFYSFGFRLERLQEIQAQIGADVTTAIILKIRFAEAAAYFQSGGPVFLITFQHRHDVFPGEVSLRSC